MSGKAADLPEFEMQWKTWKSRMLRKHNAQRIEHGASGLA